MKPIMVIGIGNLLMQDDGVGVHVINLLAEQGVPAGVKLVDGGTHSYDLLECFSADAHFIIVDAMHTGGKPGSIYRAPLNELGLRPQENIMSLHELHFIEAVQMANMLGYKPDIMVYGIEPESVALSLELSPLVAAAVPRVAELILKDIQEKLVG
ncbi:MAG: hydrogenase maturation protease [Syntrophomonadaceae bacterium]|nr:hydrogenase maturation protease [Syntrophomonadaceae bacterium]